MKDIKHPLLVFWGKALLFTAVFIGLFYLWTAIVFSHGQLFSPATAKENLIDLSSLALFSAALIAFAVWLSRLGVESKEDRKNMSFFGKLVRPVELIAASAVIILLLRTIGPISRSARSAEAHLLYNSATDIVKYPSENKAAAPFNIPTDGPVMLVNENNKTVAFLYGEYTGQLFKLKLRKESDGNSPEGLFVQYSAPLSSGGNVTAYFSHDPEEKIYMYLEDCEFTKGVELTDSKGEKWFSFVEPHQVFGFSNTAEAMTNAAEALSDTVISIKDAPALASPCGSYSTPALFIDTQQSDKYFVYTLCDDFDTTVIKNTALEKIYKNSTEYGVDELLVQAKIDIPDKGMTLYACCRYDSNNKDRTDKYVLTTPDGSVYMGHTSLISGISVSEYAVSGKNGSIPLRYFLEGWDTSGL